MNDVQVWHLVIFLIIMVFAIPLHEFGHAFAADRCGDDVPALQGRVTVEPWKHWDPLGSALIGLGIFSGMPVIGWGKPVMTDPMNYRHMRKGSLIVASAGIFVNLILAALGGLAFRLGHLGDMGADPFFSFVVSAFVAINISLAVFNLLPIPPLDGSKLLMCLLPSDKAYRYERAFHGTGMLVIYAVVIVGSSLLAGPIQYLTGAFLGN